MWTNQLLSNLQTSSPEDRRAIVKTAGIVQHWNDKYTILNAPRRPACYAARIIHGVVLNDGNIVSQLPPAPAFTQNYNALAHAEDIFLLPDFTAVSLYFCHDSWHISSANGAEVENFIMRNGLTFQTVVCELLNIKSLEDLEIPKDLFYPIYFHHEKVHYDAGNEIWAGSLSGVEHLGLTLWKPTKTAHDYETLCKMLASQTQGFYGVLFTYYDIYQEQLWTLAIESFNMINIREQFYRRKNQNQKNKK